LLGLRKKQNVGSAYLFVLNNWAYDIWVSFFSSEKFIKFLQVSKRLKQNEIKIEKYSKINIKIKIF